MTFKDFISTVFLVLLICAAMLYERPQTPLMVGSICQYNNKFVEIIEEPHQNLYNVRKLKEEFPKPNIYYLIQRNQLLNCKVK